MNVNSKLFIAFAVVFTLAMSWVMAFHIIRTIQGA